jgi:hypothetical protein
MRRRKNAVYTRVPSNEISNKLISLFYKTIDKEIPGKTPIPIVPPHSIQARLVAQAQAAVFADYAVRTIAPIALDAAGFPSEADKLRSARKIAGLDSVKSAEDALEDANKSVQYFMQISRGATRARCKDVMSVLTDAAYAVAQLNAESAEAAALAACTAARHKPDEVWAAISSMLNNL